MLHSHSQQSDLIQKAYQPHPHQHPHQYLHQAPSTVVPHPPQYNVTVTDVEEDPPYRPAPSPSSYCSQAPLGSNSVVPPTAATAPGGLVLALNPNHNHLLQSSQQSQSDKRPWWLWAIAVVDIILSIFFVCSFLYRILTQGRTIFVGDPSIVMWALFIYFASFTIHFTMGLGLAAGLNSTEHSSTLWYCQAWSYGAYFHFGELCLLFLSLLVSTKEVFGPFLVVSCRLAFRIISFILVRRFMYEISVKEQERTAAERRFFQLCQQQQHQHQQQQEPFPLGGSYPPCMLVPHS